MSDSRGGADVVRLITRLNVGGPARQALLLSKELRPKWETALAAGTPPPEEGELSDPAVAVQRLPLVRPVSPRDDMAALARTRALLKRTNPRILHTHMAKAGMIGRAAARGLGIRTVHTYHGHVLEGYFRAPSQRVFLEIERRLAKRTDVLIAISPEVRSSLLELGVGVPEQYRLIPLGFDLTAHLAVDRPSMRLRGRLALSADVPLIGTVARLVPIKDLRTFLRAVRLLPGVHAAILGDGEERVELERFSEEIRIRERVHFTGWWEDVPAAMSDLDVVVLSSLNEGTPVSLIEALACGRPVVATDVGGVRFVIEHDRTGLLVQAGAAEAMASAIKPLLESPQARRRFADKGRQVVRERFHKDRLLDDIDTLYSELTPPTAGYRSSA